MYKDGSHDRSKWHENISITSWWLAAVEAVNPASSMLGCGRGQTKNSNKCPNAFFPKMVSSFCLVLITLVYVQVFICLMSLALVSYLMLKKKRDSKDDWQQSSAHKRVEWVYGRELDTAAPSPDHHSSDSGSKLRHRCRMAELFLYNRGRREVVSIFMYVSDIQQISKQSLSCLKSHSVLYPKGVKRMKDWPFLF